MLLVFTFMVFFIPQLLNFSMAYSRCNSIVLYGIDCIEGYEDVYDLNEINEIMDDYVSKYPSVELEIKQIEVDDNNFKYEIIVSNEVEIKLIGLEYTVSSKKTSRRLSY